MIGFYDYTVILTYFSLLSATSGIVVALSGGGHPYYGCLFLLFCGFCDAFDGKVARTKKGRTRMEKDFGIQIDSLSDLVAFGVLPACIGAALIRVSPYLTGVLEGLPVRCADPGVPLSDRRAGGAACPLGDRLGQIYPARLPCAVCAGGHDPPGLL